MTRRCASSCRKSRVRAGSGCGTCRSGRPRWWRPSCFCRSRSSPAGSSIRMRRSLRVTCPVWRSEPAAGQSQLPRWIRPRSRSTACTPTSTASTSVNSSATGARSVPVSNARKGHSHLEIGDPSDPTAADSTQPDFGVHDYFVRFSYDRLDNVNFPHSGQQASLQWDADRNVTGVDEVTNQVTFSYVGAASFGRDTLVLLGQRGSDTGGQRQRTSACCIRSAAF